MKKILLASAVAAAFAAPAVQAADSPHTFTGNVGLFSQYVFRGLTQTNEKAALQGGFDYSHASGFYAGTWASNISWFTDQNVGVPKSNATGVAPNLAVPLSAPGVFAGPGVAGASGFIADRANSASLELDLYGGWKKSWGDWSVDVGLLQYYYPGTYENLGGYFSKPNTLEWYAAGGWKWISVKYSHATGDTFGVKNSSGSNYLDLTATVPLGDSGFTLIGHYGKQTYKGTSPAWTYGWGAGHSLNNGSLSYSDWKVAVAKEWVGLNWTLAATGTNAKGRVTNNAVDGVVYENVYGRNIGDSQIILSVQKTF